MHSYLLIEDEIWNWPSFQLNTTDVFITVVYSWHTSTLSCNLEILQKKKKTFSSIFCAMKKKTFLEWGHFPIAEICLRHQVTPTKPKDHPLVPLLSPHTRPRGSRRGVLSPPTSFESYKTGGSGDGKCPVQCLPAGIGRVWVSGL